MNISTIVSLVVLAILVLIVIIALNEMSKSMSAMRHSLDVTLEKDRDRAEEKIMRNEQTFLIGTDKDGKISIINATPDGDPENPEDMKVMVKETKKNRRNRRNKGKNVNTSSNTSNTSKVPNLDKFETIRIVTEVYRYTSDESADTFIDDTVPEGLTVVDIENETQPTSI
jgi:uncharacterized membrane protein YdfJ with MMPL/SSD domain